MQSKPWQIHILRLDGHMEPAENEAELLCMVRPDSGSTASLEESGQSLVLEASDHAA
jgi:hypothetical protein